MAYARFADDSDVYVFFNTDGFYECCGCQLRPRRETWFLDPAEMAEHLHEHRAAGHMVPGNCIKALRGAAKRRK